MPQISRYSTPNEQLHISAHKIDCTASYGANLGIFQLNVRSGYLATIKNLVFGTPETSQNTCPNFSGGDFSNRFLDWGRSAGRGRRRARSYLERFLRISKKRKTLNPLPLPKTSPTLLPNITKQFL